MGLKVKFSFQIFQFKFQALSKMLGLTSFLVLSLLISLLNAANSDELTEAAKAARKEVLKNFFKEELAALFDDQIHQIIEMLSQARQIAVSALGRLRRYSGMIGALSESWKVRFLNRQLDRFESEVQLFKSLPVRTQERILSHVLARMPAAEDAFEDNANVFGKIGLQFNPTHIIKRARQIRIKHPNLRTLRI